MREKLQAVKHLPRFSIQLPFGIEDMFGLCQDIDPKKMQKVTFLSFHVGVGDEPGTRRGKDGGHTELSSTGLARGDLRGRLSFASGGKRVQR